MRRERAEGPLGVRLVASGEAAKHEESDMDGDVAVKIIAPRKKEALSLPSFLGKFLVNLPRKIYQKFLWRIFNLPRIFLVAKTKKKVCSGRTSSKIA